MIEPARAAQAENNDVTTGAVKLIAVDLQAQIAQFCSMMEKLGAIHAGPARCSKVQFGARCNFKFRQRYTPLI